MPVIPTYVMRAAIKYLNSDDTFQDNLNTKNSECLDDNEDDYLLDFYNSMTE